MSVAGNTVELWKRAPAWRYCLIAAVVTTVLAVAIGRGGNQVIPPPPPPPPPPPIPPPDSSCGPAKQTVLQAPIVVSSSGRTPTNVQSSGAVSQSGPGVPSAVMASYRQFITRVDAARMEPREGERCVNMHGSLEFLQPSDYAWADCFQDGDKRLTAAQACAPQLKNSDARFARLGAAFSATQADNSAGRIEELARARNKMTGFDQSRELWNQRDGVIAAGDEASRTVADSNARISALDATRGLAVKNPADLQRLAEASQLTAFDRARLADGSQELLARADAASAQLAESDARLAAVTEALAARPEQSEAGRARLVAALGALQELDLQKASAAQKSEIERARQTVARFAYSDLVAATRNFDPASAAPDQYQRLRDLLLSIKHYAGPDKPRPDEAQAMAVARQADARLSQSDRHIARVRDVVDRVETGGPAELGDEVLEAYDQIDDFDRARMSGEDMQYFQRLEAQRNVTLATRAKQLTPSVPLFLSIEGDDQLSQQALDAVRRGLRSAGFNLVPAREQSAVTLTLNRSDIANTTVKLPGGSRLNTAEVSLSASARWTISGEAISIPTAEGDAAGSNRANLAREAVEEAAADLVKNLVQLAGS